MAVSKTPSRNGQKDLRECKTRQQHAHGRFCLAPAQRQQRGCHAKACHAGVQADLAQDQPEQIPEHAVPGQPLDRRTHTRRWGAVSTSGFTGVRTRPC